MFHALSLLIVLVNLEGEMYLVVVIFLYKKICTFSLTFYVRQFAVTVKVKKKRVYSVFTHRVS